MRSWATLLLAALTLLVPSAAAQDRQALADRAVSAALDSFETAWPSLEATLFGVDTAAYRDAISLQRFASAYWGGTIAVDLVRAGDDGGDCARFAAYTRMPPENGTIRLVLCPQFFSPGADELRELTILHEMVHVVAGPDECRAMAFAARIEALAKGRHTQVDAYWQANGCRTSAFRLP